MSRAMTRADQIMNMTNLNPSYKLEIIDILTSIFLAGY